MKIKKYKLKEIFEIKVGKNISKENIKENLGNFPVYSGKILNNGILGKIKNFFLDGEYITMIRDGYPGKVFYRKGKFSCTCHVFYFKLNVNFVNLKYVFFLLKNKEEQIKNKIMGTCKKYITIENILNLEIFLPSILEQNKSIYILNWLENKLEKFHNLLKKIFFLINYEIYNNDIKIDYKSKYKINDICNFYKNNISFKKSNIENKMDFIVLTKKKQFILNRNDESNNVFFSLKEEYKNKIRIEYLYILFKDFQDKYIKLFDFNLFLLKLFYIDFKFIFIKKQEKIIEMYKNYENLKKIGDFIFLLKKDFEKILII